MRERERRLLLSWAKAGKDSKESREATRSEGDDLEESAARALMRHGGRGRGVRGEGNGGSRLCHRATHDTACGYLTCRLVEREAGSSPLHATVTPLP